MRVEVCEPGGNKVVVVPQPNSQCNFVAIESWDENAHPKNCDTMYYLKDGSGAYVWNCEEWVFLEFSNNSGGSDGGGIQADWDAPESEPDGIKNKPFQTLSDQFTVKKDELAIDEDSLRETAYTYIINLPDNVSDLNFDIQDPLFGWYHISSVASPDIQNVPPGYSGTSFLLEAAGARNRPVQIQRVWPEEDDLKPMFRTSINGVLWNDWREF